MKISCPSSNTYLIKKTYESNPQTFFSSPEKSLFQTEYSSVLTWGNMSGLSRELQTRNIKQDQTKHNNSDLIHDTLQQAQANSKAFEEFLGKMEHQSYSDIGCFTHIDPHEELIQNSWRQAKRVLFIWPIINFLKYVYNVLAKQGSTSVRPLGLVYHFDSVSDLLSLRPLVIPAYWAPHRIHSFKLSIIIFLQTN